MNCDNLKFYFEINCNMQKITIETLKPKSNGIKILLETKIIKLFPKT